MKKKVNKKYSLFTALAMIIGIVIGSGIFFKTDNVLEYTSWNILLWAIIFSFAAIAIIFGSLSIAELAKRTDKPGGLIAYADEFLWPHFSTMIWWFQVYLYYPTLAVIVSWVVWIYFISLFSLESSLELQVAIWFAWFMICYGFNMISAWFWWKFQEASTIIKLIPLIILWVLAFIYWDPANAILNPSTEAVEATKTLAWFWAIWPIAFSFDGWIVSTSISNEIKNSKRNLPLALIIAPIVILILYLIYFVWISSYIWAEKVLELWDNSAYLAATNMFWATAAKVFLIFIIISVMWTVNGLILWYIRLPYSLALKGRIFFSNKLKEINKKFNMPIYSAIFGIIISLFWWVIHYFSMKDWILWKMDISEVSIVVSYILYVIFYIKVILMWKSWEIKNIFLGLISPIIATIWSVFILFGWAQNEMFLKLILPICVSVLVLAYLYSLISSKLKRD